MAGAKSVKRKRKVKKNMSSAEKRREVERTFSGRTEAEQKKIDAQRAAQKRKRKVKKKY